MTRLQTQFINILRCFANNEKCWLPKDADLKSLFLLGRVNNLSAVICYVLNTQIINDGFKDKESAKKFQKILFTTVTLQSQRLVAFRGLLDHLNNKKITTVLMKGAVINKYYDDPMLRTFGDIDFLVESKDYDRLDKLMVGLGYEKKVVEDTVTTYVKGNEKYEVHTALLPNRQVLSEGMCEFIDSAFQNIDTTQREYIFTLKPDYHFAFLLLHLAKHMRASGAGARMYLDLALMIKNEPDLDFEKVKNFSANLGLLDFLNTAFLLTEKWFGVLQPIKTKPLSQGVFMALEEYVISGGVFGYYDRNPAISRIRENKGQRGALREYIFPRYNSIKNRYKFLNSRPYLLPLGWISRWFDGIFLRRKRAEKILKGMMTLGNEAKQSDEMLNLIGIKDSIK